MLQATESYNVKLIAERARVYDTLKTLERLPELDYKPTRKYTESSK